MYYAVQVRIPPNGDSEGYWKQITPDDMTDGGGLAIATYIDARKTYTEVRLIAFTVEAAVSEYSRYR